MKITVTAIMLCDLLGGKFTLEACEALCDWYEGLEDYSYAPAIGDIACSFSEIRAEDADEEGEENIIARLDNGNVLVAL